MSRPVRGVEFGRAKPMKDTENNLENANEVRIAVGLTPLKHIWRTCLRCDKKFKALGYNNRMCGCLRESQWKDV